MKEAEKVAVAKRLLGAVSAMKAEKQSGAKVKLVGEVVRILASLGVSTKPKSIYSDITESPEKAFNAIQSLMDGSDEATIYGAKLAGFALTKHDKFGQESDEVKGLWDIARSMPNADLDGIMQRAKSRGDRVMQALTDDVQQAKSLIDNFSAKFDGFSVFDTEFGRKFLSGLDEESAQYATNLLDTIEKLQEFEERGITYNSDGSESDLQEYKNLRAKFGDLHWTLRKLMESKGDTRDISMIQTKYRLKKEAEKKAFDSAYGLIAAKSTITEQQANDWAAKQVITKTAKARMSRNGYKEADIRRDMAEFYRFTNGRVKAFTIDSNGGKRAHTHGVGNMSEKPLINIDTNFNKQILWHEMAHHIETDPVAKLAAGRFIKSKSIDGKAYTLRELSGNKAYSRDEVAYKDGFFNPYVGKLYKDGVTEVFSMAVESFSSPDLLAQRMAQDPDTFAFVIGYMTNEKSKIEQVFDATLGDSMDAVIENKETIEEAYKRAIKGYASKAKIVELTDDESAISHRVRLAVVSGGVRYILMTDRVRSAKGRMGDGYSVIEVVNGSNFLKARIPTRKEADLLSYMGMIGRFSHYTKTAVEFANMNQVVKWAVEDGVITL